MSKKNKTRICIIGMPGSGKSTIGSLLSEKLKYRFIDLDNEIEINTGLKIKEIFKDMGEDSFRKIETDTLNKLIHKDRIVISTGGGTIIKNEEILKKSYNILLNCKLNELVKRASRNKNRPLLSSNVESKMKDLFNERKELYNKIADLKIEASTNITETIADILSSLENDY